MWRCRYCAPEVLAEGMNGAPRVKRKAPSDMWSVGVMAYELFTETRLFDESLSDDQVVALLCSVSLYIPNLPSANNAPYTLHEYTNTQFMHQHTH